MLDNIISERFTRFVRLYNSLNDRTAFDPDYFAHCQTLAEELSDLTVHMERIGENCKQALWFCGMLATGFLTAESSKTWVELWPVLLRCAAAYEARHIQKGTPTKTPQTNGDGDLGNKKEGAVMTELERIAAELDALATEVAKSDRDPWEDQGFGEEITRKWNWKLHVAGSKLWDAKGIIFKMVIERCGELPPAMNMANANGPLQQRFFFECVRNFILKSHPNLRAEPTVFKDEECVNPTVRKVKVKGKKGAETADFYNYPELNRAELSSKISQDARVCRALSLVIWPPMNEAIQGSAGGGGGTISSPALGDDPATKPMTPDQEAFFEALPVSPAALPARDIIKKLAKEGIHHFDESKISRMSKLPHLKARGVRHAKGAGYYRLQIDNKSTAN